MKGNLLAVVLIAIVAVGCASPTGAVSPPPTSTPMPSPSDRPIPSPRPSTAPTPTPAPEPPSVALRPATVPEGENSSATTQVLVGTDGLVAIGFDGAFGSTLWTSSDGGKTWTDATPPEFASIGLARVIEWDGGFVGVGRGSTTDIEVEEAAVYRSDDGIAWRKAATMVGQLIDAVATQDGLFAVGGVPGADAAGVWHSTDGEAWARIGADFEHAFLWAIAEGGPGLVAVGWRRNPEPDLAVWTSADAGATWQLSPDADGFAGAEATDVAVLPDGSLVLVGSRFDGSGGLVWRSDDGLAWDLVLPDMDGAYARSLDTLPDGTLIATGGDDRMQGRAWVTSDGIEWTVFGDPVPGAYFHRAFPTDDGALLVGATQGGTPETGIEAHAAIWEATLDRP
jgi:hypothetical protein